MLPTGHLAGDSSLAELGQGKHSPSPSWAFRSCRCRWRLQLQLHKDLSHVPKSTENVPPQREALEDQTFPPCLPELPSRPENWLLATNFSNFSLTTQDCQRVVLAGPDPRAAEPEP